MSIRTRESSSSFKKVVEASLVRDVLQRKHLARKCFINCVFVCVLIARRGGGMAVFHEKSLLLYHSETYIIYCVGCDSLTRYGFLLDVRGVINLSHYSLPTKALAVTRSSLYVFHSTLGTSSGGRTKRRSQTTVVLIDGLAFAVITATLD